MTKTLEQAIADRRRVLQNQYAYLTEKEEIAELKAAHRQSENPYSHADELAWLARPISRFDGISVEGQSRNDPVVRRLTDGAIEQLAREIQLQMWSRRAELFHDHLNLDPVEMLDPIVALKMIGYEVQLVDALGQLASSSKHVSNVAGVIDKTRQQVLLSSAFPNAIKNFTAAHELGHALMHEFVGMHRDIPLDGSAATGDRQEREAQKFAAYFLLPEKPLKRVFEEMFGEYPFILDDNMRFALSGTLPSAGWNPRTLRELSRLLSAAERFNGRPIQSLMSRFRVSKEAMAIRLEQLGLVSVK